MMGRATHQRELPARQELPLTDDGIGMAQVGADKDSRPPVARPGTKLQRVTGSLQERTERGQAVATANVLGTVDERKQTHRRSSMTTLFVLNDRRGRRGRLGRGGR